MRLLIVRSTLIERNSVYVVVLFQVYSKSNEWKLLAKWSVSFSNETKVYDETDSKLLNLVSAVLFFFLFSVLIHSNETTSLCRSNLSITMYYACTIQCTVLHQFVFTDGTRTKACTKGSKLY